MAHNVQLPVYELQINLRGFLRNPHQTRTGEAAFVFKW